jgi:ribonucleotide reductase alpha subunit
MRKKYKVKRKTTLRYRTNDTQLKALKRNGKSETSRHGTQKVEKKIINNEKLKNITTKKNTKERKRQVQCFNEKHFPMKNFYFCQ